MNNVYLHFIEKIDKNMDSSVLLKGGVYLFLFKNTPFYVGTASIFSNRLFKHKDLFSKGLRTYFPNWIGNMSDNLWSDDNLKEVYVPTTERKGFDKRKSITFWESLDVLIFLFEKYDKHQAEYLEEKLQNFLREALIVNNESVSIALRTTKGRIPGTRSYYFGKPEGGKTQYTFNILNDFNNNDLIKEFLSTNLFKQII